MAPLDPTSLAEVLIIALSLVALCSPPRNPDGRAALVFQASEVPRDSVVSGKASTENCQAFNH